VTRTHKDFDIAVLRDDQLDLQQFLRGWGLAKVLYGTGGRLYFGSSPDYPLFRPVSTDFTVQYHGAALKS